jgi:uncharacterized protein YxeA
MKLITNGVYKTNDDRIVKLYFIGDERDVYFKELNDNKLLTFTFYFKDENGDDLEIYIKDDYNVEIVEYLPKEDYPQYYV